MKRTRYYYTKTLDKNGYVKCNSMISLYEDRQRAAGEVVTDWAGNRFKIDWCMNPDTERR